MRKIFFENRQIILCNINQFPEYKNRLLFNNKTLSYDINKFSKNETIETLVIETENLENLIKEFERNFKIVEAGGGVVKNEKSEYLFIFRNGKWDLPKGKQDKGETMAQTALREVSEETGITKIRIDHFLTTTYHSYYQKDILTLKPSYWFAMNYKGNENLIPQTLEGITEVRWIAPKDFNIIKENVFASILDVVNLIS